MPDADVIGFKMGIEYGDFLGHRGFFHSPFFSLLLSASLTLVFFRKQTQSWIESLKAFLFLFVVGASHGLLDAMTDGGLGIALLTPFDDTRYFFPWRPIEVAPIGLKYMIGDWGKRVMFSEILFIWLPGIAAVSVMSLIRHSRREAHKPE